MHKYACIYPCVGIMNSLPLGTMKTVSSSGFKSAQEVTRVPYALNSAHPFSKPARKPRPAFGHTGNNMHIQQYLIPFQYSRGELARTQTYFPEILRRSEAVCLGQRQREPVCPLTIAEDV